MTQQVFTAFFDSRTEAEEAIAELVAAGIPRTGIKLMPETEVAPRATVSTTYDRERDERGFWASLSDLFLPDEDRFTYAEAMDRGTIMVSVSVDAAQADEAEDILETYGTVNIEELEASWRDEGWSGYAPGFAQPMASAAHTRRDAPAGAEEKIPLIEEHLKIGKRQVSGGRVKVRSYVVETPVSEQVNLRQETVRVERRPVDRALTAAESDRMFQDRTIEAEARSEEAVVSKDARVMGEVVVKKAVEDRTETVTDTVRSTKVDVDDARAPTPSSRADPKAALRR